MTLQILTELFPLRTIPSDIFIAQGAARRMRAAASSCFRHLFYLSLAEKRRRSRPDDVCLGEAAFIRGSYKTPSQQNRANRQ
ncbi:hypothetical protein J6590_036905 [Homalodisca vitripennis]|nr:hypothetical protein J6590_036905 [Homalodisca vitripennis]